MSEEFSFGLDDAGETWESGWEAVSEEAQQRARDDTAKAKQVRTQIQQVSHQNAQFAMMLTLLLQSINNDAILWIVFNQLIEKKVPTPAIFAQFLPYMKTKVAITSYKELYGALWEKIPQETNVSSLVDWLKEVRWASQALQNISLDEYSNFTLLYIEWMWAIDMKILDAEKKEALVNSVRKELG